MIEKKSFNLIYPYITVEDVRRSLAKLGEIISGYNSENELNSISNDDASDIIYLAEKIDLSVRDSYESETENDEETRKIATENLPVSVQFDGVRLTVKTPLTIKRAGRSQNEKHNYMLLNYVRAGIKKWQKDNDICLYKSLDWPLVAFIIRKGKSYDFRKICDNDNIENGRIINEIFSALGYSDNVRIMDLYTKFEVVSSPEEVGTEFILVSKKNREEVIRVMYRQ